MKVNFTWTILMLQPREDTDVQCEQYKASARLSAPLNCAPYQATFESRIQQNSEERKIIG